MKSFDLEIWLFVLLCIDEVGGGASSPAFDSESDISMISGLDFLLRFGLEFTGGSPSASESESEMLMISGYKTGNDLGALDAI